MAEVSDLGAFALGFGTGGFDALTYRNRIKKSDELRDESLRGQAMRNADFLKNIQREADQESARLAYDLERFRRSASTQRGQQALNEGPVQPGVAGASMMAARGPVRYAALESVLKRMTPEDREQVMADFEVDKYRQASEEMRKNLGQRIAASTRTGAYSRDGSPSVDPEMQAVLDQYQEVLQAKVEFQTPDEAKDYTDKLAAATEAEALIRVKFNKEKALIQQKQSLGMKGAASMADLESKGFDVTPLYNVYSLFMADAITAEQYQKAMAGAKVVPAEDADDEQKTRQGMLGTEANQRAQMQPAPPLPAGARDRMAGQFGGAPSSPQVPANGVPRGTQPDAARQQTFKQLVQQVTAGAGIEETANALGLDPETLTDDELAILEAVAK